MGWDINMTPKYPPEWWQRMYAQPAKKPRARQLRDGCWWIHIGDARQPSVVGWSLPNAWQRWEQLCLWSASQ